MPSRNALAWLRRQKEDRLAVDEIEALVATLEEASEAEHRLALVTGQILTAETTLAEVRAAAERENLERRERIAAARAGIAKAEEDARARIAAIEGESAQRLTTTRAQAETELAAVRAAHEQALLEIRAERSREAALLSEIKARRLEAQRALAPLVAEQA